MRVRLSIAWLLILMTMPLAQSHSLFIKGNPPLGQQESELTQQEEQEAIAVGKRFSERWRETIDLGQIIDEMFVKDFSERLWQVPQDELPWALIDKTLIAHTSPKALRRYYVAALNFYGLYAGLYEAVERLREESENKDDSLTMVEVLSPEVIQVLLSNRTFALLVEMSKEEERDEHAKEGDTAEPAQRADSAPIETATAEADAQESTEQSESGIIKELAQLHDASATLEKANELMVKRLAKMSQAAQATSGNDDAKRKRDVANPSLSRLDEEEYGYPKETPTIHLYAAPYCLQLIKIEGKFMILSASVCVD